MRSTISVFTEHAFGLTRTSKRETFGYRAHDERRVNTVYRKL